MKISALQYNRKGFTLLECILAMAIMSLIFIAAYSLFIFGIRTYEAGRQKVDVQQNVRIAADFIFREVRYARTLDVPSPSEIRFTFPGDDNHYAIKLKGEEIVLLTNFVENKVAYQIKDLQFFLCDQRGVVGYHILGGEDDDHYALQGAFQVRNFRQGGEPFAALF